MDDAFYREFFDRAKMGETTARAVLVHRYTTMREEMPDYCIEYVERFIQNVAHDIGHGENITNKLFPENPRKKSNFDKKFNVAGFVYRKVKNEGLDRGEALGMACDEFGLELRTVQERIQEAQKYGDENPDFWGAGIDFYIGARQEK